MTAAADVLDVLRALLAMASLAAGGVWLIVCLLVDYCRRRRAEARKWHDAYVELERRQVKTEHLAVSWRTKAEQPAERRCGRART